MASIAIKIYKKKNKHRPNQQTNPSIVIVSSPQSYLHQNKIVKKKKGKRKEVELVIGQQVKTEEND